MTPAVCYVFDPVMFDQFFPTANAPAPGTLVRKVQPPHAPKNGTMGNCYVQPIDSDDAPFALVMVKSLRRATKSDFPGETGGRP